MAKAKSKQNLHISKSEEKKRKRSEEEEEEEQEDEDVASQSNDDEDDVDNDNEEEEQQEKKKDGFADTIMNLLKQDTGSKLPVLSGRKTALMKQMQEHQKEAKVQELKRLEKKRRIEAKMIRPQENNIEFERQLRKLATKGVVALFNAVAKAKKEIADAEQQEKTKSEAAIEKAKEDSSVTKSLLQTRETKGSLKTESTNSEKKVEKKKWNVLSENTTEDLLMVREQPLFIYLLIVAVFVGLGSRGR